MKKKNKNNVICNPLNLGYKYQFIEKYEPIIEGKQVKGEKYLKTILCREAADPSAVLFKGKYLIFPSMSKGFWASDDLIEWEYVPLKNTPHYDYAPDVRVKGDYLYFCASDNAKKCMFYRTKDPFSGEFEEISATFTFWDPNMFFDDDGKTYFYWGCSCDKPIFGVELDENMKQKGDVRELISDCHDLHGFERRGEDHKPPVLKSDASEFEKAIYFIFKDKPAIEGAWMTKHNGKYYLQYAAPGTEFNVYGDGVYISDNPLGKFVYAKNNPYSYKPGGFIRGAGHGSTFWDKYGNLWHISTMSIGVNHSYERRLGLFPAGFDEEGELFCNQRYGDWPMKIPQGKADPWAEPKSYLLSYGAKACASSTADGRFPELAFDENARTWWRAEKSGEAWIKADLGEICSVDYVQLNFADEIGNPHIPQGAESLYKNYEKRYIEDLPQKTCWILEGSTDGEVFETICDKTDDAGDLPHDFIYVGKRFCFLRCTVTEMPYSQPAAISGFRIFGKADGDKPESPIITKAERVGSLDADIEWRGSGIGYVVLWGYTPKKLYHSCMVFGENKYRIGALNDGHDCYVRVDAFNRSGITHGETIKIE